MAFDLLFGKNTSPGSAAVYNKLLALDRNGAWAFCSSRRNSIGGSIYVKGWQLWNSGVEARSHGRLEEACKSFFEANEVFGKFRDPDQLEMVASTLIELGRYKEAAALAYTGFEQTQGKMFRSLLESAYNKLGYTFESKAKKSQQQFDDKDLMATLDALLKVDESESWDQQLFLLTHVLYHVHRNEKASFKVFNRMHDFIPGIIENEKLVTLSITANLATVTTSESRFLAYFCLLIAKWMESDTNTTTLLLTKQYWFQTLMGQFPTSFTTEESLVKLASMEPGAAEPLLRGWSLIAAPLSTGIMDRGDDMPLITKPFEDFNWCCDVAVLFIFSGVRLDNCPDNGSTDISMTMVRCLTKLFKNKKYFLPMLRTLPKKVFAKALDVLLMLSAINFAEWKHVANDPSAYGSHGDKDGIPMTNDWVLMGLTALLPSITNATREFVKPSFFLEHLSYFVTAVERFLFYMSQLNITIAVSHLTCLTMCYTWATNAGQLYSLANCEAFCSRLIKSMTIFASYQSMGSGKKSEQNLIAFFEMLVFGFVNHFVASSRFSVFVKLLIGSEASSLIDLIFNKAVSQPNCFTRLIDAVDNETRMKWSIEYQNTLLLTCVQIIDKLLKPGITRPDEYVNLMLAFHNITSEQPAMIPMEQVLSLCGSQRVDALREQLFAAVCDFPRLTQWNSPSGESFTPMMRIQFLMMGPLAASLLLVRLTSTSDETKAHKIPFKYRTVCQSLSKTIDKLKRSTSQNDD